MIIEHYSYNHIIIVISFFKSVWPFLQFFRKTNKFPMMSESVVSSQVRILHWFKPFSYGYRGEQILPVDLSVLTYMLYNRGRT